MKRLLIACFVVCISAFFLTANSNAADSSYTMEQHHLAGMNVIEYTFTASSSSGGYSAVTTPNIDGFIIMAETSNAAAPYTPTALYDIVINKTSIDGMTSVDIFGGTLANRSGTSVQRAMPLQNGNYTGVPNQGSLSIAITNNSVVSAVIRLKIFYYP